MMKYNINDTNNVDDDNYDNNNNNKRVYFLTMDVSVYLPDLTNWYLEHLLWNWSEANTSKSRWY